MESNIENLENTLNKNQEIVYVNDAKENLNSEILKDKLYDIDETKKEFSLQSSLEDDCNDSILTLNKEYDNDSSQLSLNSEEEYECINEDNNTHVNAENSSIDNTKFK